MRTIVNGITKSIVEFLGNEIQAKVFVPQRGTFIVSFPSTRNFSGGLHFNKLLAAQFDFNVLAGNYPLEIAFKRINAQLYLADYEMMTNLSLVLDKDEERKRIGNRIKELRKVRKITAKQLGEFSGIAPCNISRVESGLYSIGFDMLTRIANALGCRVDLVEEDTPKQKKEDNSD